MLYVSIQKICAKEMTGLVMLGFIAEFILGAVASSRSGEEHLHNISVGADYCNEILLTSL